MLLKKIPIVFTFDRRYLLPAKIAIRSLIDFSNVGTFYDVFLINTDLTIEDKKFLTTDLGDPRKYKITWIPINEAIFKNVPITFNWPKSVYFRLLLPDLINSYKKIIYSDVDVLFQGDLSSVYDADIDNYYWSGVIAEENKKAVCHQFFPENKNKYIYMSGFMVLNLDKMRKDRVVIKFFKNIDKFRLRLKMFDLEILNLSCNKIKSIPLNYCVLENIFSRDDFKNASEYSWLLNYYSHKEIVEARSKPIIIHYAGNDIKIWNRQEIEVGEPYLKYMKMFRKSYILLNQRFKNLQVGDNDLVGNKFNGFDLHLYLREKGIDSNHLVWNKESDDKHTFVLAGDRADRNSIRFNAIENQEKYSIDSVCNPVVYDIIYNKLFLESDVVHFHLIHNHIFDIQLLPIISRLKPLVWSIHDPWVLGGHCIHHFDCEKWLSGCGDCPHLDTHFKLNKDNSALNYEIKKIAIQNSDFDVIVASNWMKKKVLESPLFKGKRVHLIPFGINHNIFKPRSKNIVRKELGIPLDAIVLTFRCDYSGFKGMDYIQYIIDNLKTDKKVFFVSLKDKLIDKNERFSYKEFGWVKDDVFLSKIYNASDLFLSPSKADSFGLMAAEAMSCGVLPVVLDGTALPNTVNAPICGVSVERNKKKYLDTVKYFIDNDSERLNKSKKCMEYAKSKYSLVKYLDAVINVYKDVIDRHKLTADYFSLLKQLTKYMSIDPCLCEITPHHVGVFTKLRNHLLVIFYKFDKLVPKKIRKSVKSKISKFKFVKKYLIK